jgi:hypothetical protein
LVKTLCIMVKTLCIIMKGRETFAMSKLS